MSVAFVTMTSPHFTEGSRVLISSIKRHNPERRAVPWLVLDFAGGMDSDPKLRKMVDQVVPVTMADFPDMPVEDHQKVRSTLCKLNTFRDFGFDRHIFLDSDVVCVDTIEDLFEPEPTGLIFTRDWVFEGGGFRGVININSAVFAVDRQWMGEQTFRELIGTGPERKPKGAPGDQRVVQKWLGLRRLPFRLLESTYNLDWMALRAEDRDYWASKARLFHYMGSHKPWRRTFWDLYGHRVPVQMREAWREAVEYEKTRRNSAGDR